MKKYLIMLLLVVGYLSPAAAAKGYDIVGVYHDAETTISPKNRVITDDGRISKVTMELIPAFIRERTYEVSAVRIAENVYKIESSDFHLPLYIELRSCKKKGERMQAQMTIDNMKGDIKGTLTFK